MTRLSDEMQAQMLEANDQAQRKINRTRRIILLSAIAIVPILALAGFVHQGGPSYVAKVATSSSASWWAEQLDTTAEDLLPECTRTLKYQFCRDSLSDRQCGRLTLVYSWLQRLQL